MMNSVFVRLAAQEKKKRPADFAYLVSKPENIGYLSGFWGTFGRLLVTPRETVLISDARYADSARTIAARKKMKFLLATGGKDFWPKVWKAFRVEALGIEADAYSVNALKNFRKGAGGIALVLLPELVEHLRAKKAPSELRWMKKAATITDRTLTDVLQNLRIGMRESEVAWLLEKTAREQYGAEGVSFPPIVAFGRNSAVPHHESGGTKLKKNTPLLIDFGVKYGRYCSDMTRSFFFGTPSAEWSETYQAVLQAQEKGIIAIMPGKSFASPDVAARISLEKKEKFFTHSFGHGVGLEIHEAPSLSRNARGEFQTGMTVTAEPGIYVSGKFGIRIEDLLVVENKGARSLSSFPKDLSSVVLG